jgi:hypothetical protein
VLQVNVHALLAQAAEALATLVVHVLPQALQFFGSLVRSTQLSLQFVGVALGHTETQAYVPASPAAQTAVPVHALAQLPQFAGVVSSTHAPPSQRPYPTAHEKEQTPEVHTGCAFATDVVHALPHEPQFSMLSAPSHTSPASAASPGSRASPAASSPPSAPPSATTELSPPSLGVPDSPVVASGRPMGAPLSGCGVTLASHCDVGHSL